MKLKWFIVILILIILMGLSVFFLLQTKNVCFEDNCFKIELAKTSEEKERGLMFRKELEENKGMLFIYPREGKYDFWMKNTLIPLDIIWIDKDKKVVFINRNAQPCLIDICSTIHPSTNAQYILEINGGLAEKLGIIEGSHCVFR